MWRDSIWYDQELAKENSPERNLLAAVIQLAIDDCKNGFGDDAVRAYRWLTGPFGWCRFYLGLLGIDYGRARERIVAEYENRINQIEWKLHA